MMNQSNKIFKNILIIQTAFAGDVILTLPLLEAIKEKYQESRITFLCIPNTASILENNPYLDDIIIYDKKDSQKGIFQFRKLIKEIKSKEFDLIISPHRSLRSTMISYLSKVKDSVSFDTSALSSKYKIKVIYNKNVHEIVRNLSLLVPLGIVINEIIPPKLFPSEKDIHTVDTLLKSFKISQDEKFITVSPGSVWYTKAYPELKFIKLMNILNDIDIKVVLTGGADDFGLCAKIKVLCKNYKVYNAAGKLTFLQSSELIRRSEVLVTNDSAPMHLANAVGTKVIALFGATIPEFGFYPYGKNDIIFQINGLKCRPCGIHGGNRCPIKSFDCMNRIDETDIALEIMKSITS